MPIRSTPLREDNIYHIINQGYHGKDIFLSHADRHRCLRTLDYYRKARPLRFSNYQRLSSAAKGALDLGDNSSVNQVEILAFCLMSNHYHLLLKQLSPDGIVKFQTNWQISYAKYFNIRHRQDKSLFNDRYESIHIKSEYQLNHTVRYIHLNPYSVFAIKDLEDLSNYSWSSLSCYTTSRNDHPFVNTAQVKNCFSPTDFSEDEYLRFTLEQANYQRHLQTIKTSQKVNRY